MLFRSGPLARRPSALPPALRSDSSAPSAVGSVDVPVLRPPPLSLSRNPATEPSDPARGLRSASLTQPGLAPTSIPSKLGTASQTAVPAGLPPTPLTAFLDSLAYPPATMPPAGAGQPTPTAGPTPAGLTPYLLVAPLPSMNEPSSGLGILLHACERQAASFDEDGFGLDPKATSVSVAPSASIRAAPVRPSVVLGAGADEHARLSAHALPFFTDPLRGGALLPLSGTNLSAAAPSQWSSSSSTAVASVLSAWLSSAGLPSSPGFLQVVFAIFFPCHPARLPPRKYSSSKRVFLARRLVNDQFRNIFQKSKQIRTCPDRHVQML